MTCLADRLSGPVFVPNEPANGANAQGGARVNVTSGRVDWSVSAYRGFRPFGIYTQSRPAGALRSSYPRFTMMGGDFETVAGPWVVRGEVAAFHARRVPGARPPRRR